MRARKGDSAESELILNTESRSDYQRAAGLRQLRFVEATVRIELTVSGLQPPALPLGYVASISLIQLPNVGNKVADDTRCSGVKAHHVHHASVIWVGNSKAIALHTDHYQLRRDAGLFPVDSQCL